ncbi:hypothetical protein BJX99DRAFT_242592 [Aspergillus californicus]
MNITTVLSCVLPLIMALVNPQWGYWRCTFVAICLNSVAADSLSIVSNVLIAGVFPPEKHGIAAGVFTTVLQIGKSFGLTFVELVANLVRDQQAARERDTPGGLMVGYRAAFWLLLR